MNSLQYYTKPLKPKKVSPIMSSMQLALDGAVASRDEEAIIHACDPIRDQIIAETPTAWLDMQIALSLYKAGFTDRAINITRQVFGLRNGS